MLSYLQNRQFAQIDTKRIVIEPHMCIWSIFAEAGESTWAWDEAVYSQYGNGGLQSVEVNSSSRSIR
jgi:hypothetical protein